MKKTFYVAVTLALLSSPAYAQRGSPTAGEGLAQEGGEPTTMRRSGNAAPFTIPGSQVRPATILTRDIVVPQRRTTTAYKRSSKKMRSGPVSRRR